MVGGESSTPKPIKVAKPTDSPASYASSAPTRNGKHVKSEAVVKSDSEEEAEDQTNGEMSDESRFSDSEDDR